MCDQRLPAFLSDSRRATTSLNRLWIAATFSDICRDVRISELRWSVSAPLWSEMDLASVYREDLTVPEQIYCTDLTFFC